MAELCWRRQEVRSASGITSSRCCPPLIAVRCCVKPRDSRWSELKPNESANFIVARTMLDPDYWFHCMVIGALELTLPGDKQPIRLPFEAGSCQVTVSAWRAGRYDGDPMNVQYDR